MPRIPNALPGQRAQDLPSGTQNSVSPVPDFELRVTGDPLPGDDCVPEPPNSDERSTSYTILLLFSSHSPQQGF